MKPEENDTNAKTEKKETLEEKIGNFSTSLLQIAGNCVSNSNAARSEAEKLLGKAEAFREVSVKLAEFLKDEKE